MMRRNGKGLGNFRVTLLVLISVASIGLISVRLFVLQVLSHDYYSELAKNQHRLSQELLPNRGEIFIRDRYSKDPYPVVTNENRPLVYAIPPQIQDAPDTAKQLAAVLDLDPREVLQKISDPNRKYVIIAKQVPEKTAEQIDEMNLPGIFFENETYLRYPENELAAQVLGFVAYDGNRRTGRYGLEYYFEKELAGTAGRIDAGLGGAGIFASDERKFIAAQDGVDLILTIDRAIQFKVEEVLKKSVEAYQAKGGSVIVLNPKTGAVLAMANYPTFNPNEFNLVEDVSVYTNRAIQTAYEPGSVMKPITFAASLNEEKITPDMTFEDPGFVTLENFTIRNAENKKYGEVTMTQVLEDSINTGAIFAEQQIGHKVFRQYLEKFGFGKATGITLPFESSGDISNLYRGGDLYPATASYGQGITATPLQIVTAFAAIANGGKLYKPYVVEQMVFPDGNVQVTEPELVTEVISPRTASTLGAMLVSVVERGHGKRAGVPGYFIAGKTGTAQIAYEDRPGYDPDRTIGTFVGFGPIEDPVFAMIVKIDEPQTVRFAGSSAAPTFGEIAQFILNYYQIPANRE